jgi:chromosome segregation ATPase
VRDPADDVQETLDQVKNRLEAMKRARPTLEANLSRMRLALIRAQAVMEHHERNIEVLEQVVAAGGRRDQIEVKVDRIPDPAPG